MKDNIEKLCESIGVQFKDLVKLNITIEPGFVVATAETRKHISYKDFNRVIGDINAQSSKG